MNEAINSDGNAEALPSSSAEQILTPGSEIIEVHSAIMLPDPASGGEYGEIPDDAMILVASIDETGVPQLAGKVHGDDLPSAMAEVRDDASHNLTTGTENDSGDSTSIDKMGIDNDTCRFRTEPIFATHDGATITPPPESVDFDSHAASQPNEDGKARLITTS